MEIQPQSKNKLILAAGAGIIIILIIVGITWYKQSNPTSLSDNTNSGADTLANTDLNTQENQQAANNNTTTPANNTSTSTTKNSNSNTPVSTSTYKDGTYTADATYQSPGGTEKITVTLTLKNDKVTAANVTSYPAEHDSQYYQQQFIDNYKSFVIGKDISSLQLSRVAGSSLTPGGFNQAVAEIKAKAKA